MVVKGMLDHHILLPDVKHIPQTTLKIIYPVQTPCKRGLSNGVFF